MPWKSYLLHFQIVIYRAALCTFITHTHTHRSALCSLAHPPRGTCQLFLRRAPHPNKVGGGGENSREHVCVCMFVRRCVCVCVCVGAFVKDVAHMNSHHPVTYCVERVCVNVSRPEERE